MAQQMLWTLDDLDRFPDDGNRYELLHGDLFVTPPPEPDHETALGRLNALLVPYVGKHQLGLVFGGHPVIRTQDSHVEPDLIVRHPPPPKSRWEAAELPILVVEVLSPYTKRRDWGPKRDFYINEKRVETYWIVDPENRRVTVIRPDQSEHVVHDRLVWSPAGVAESLEIALAEVFGSGAQQGLPLCSSVYLPCPTVFRGSRESSMQQDVRTSCNPRFLAASHAPSSRRLTPLCTPLFTQ